MFKKKVLVVGGTGFIGSNLVGKIRKKFDVYSLSLTKPKKKFSDVRYLYCDITQKKKLKKKLNKNFNFIINLGGYIDHSKSKKTYKTHYLGFKNLCEIFIDKKIEKFVQFGSCLEYGYCKAPQNENQEGKNIKSDYTFGKQKATNYALNLYKKKNFPITIFRLFQAYGPGQDFKRLIPQAINKFLKGEELNLSHGSQIRDFIYIDDVSEAILKLLKLKNTSGEIINLGSGKGYKIKKIILLIKKLCKGGNPKFNKIKMRENEPKILYANINKIKKLFNWKPRVEILEGLEKTIKYYKKI